MSDTPYNPQAWAEFNPRRETGGYVVVEGVIRDGILMSTGGVNLIQHWELQKTIESYGSNGLVLMRPSGAFRVPMNEPARIAARAHLDELFERHL